MRRTGSPFVVRLPSDWTFFGLTQTYKVQLHDQVFDLVYHGKGFTYHEVYSMPVYLRHFYVRKIQHIYSEEKKAHEKSMREAKSKQPKKPNIRR